MGMLARVDVRPWKSGLRRREKHVAKFCRRPWGIARPRVGPGENARRGSWVIPAEGEGEGEQAA